MVISKNYKDTEKILRENKYNHLRIMVDFLKRSKPEGEKWEEDEKVRKSVEEIFKNNG